MSVWIVEASVVRTGGESFERAVRQVDGELRWLSIDDEFNGRYGMWEAGRTVVFRGSFEAAESFRRARPDAFPGVIGESEALRCASYYPILGDRLLNAAHRFVPLRELRDRWSEIQALFGPTPFIRPDSGAKAFTGQIVADLDRFEARERPYLNAMDGDERIVVAAPKQIEAEWRMVVVGGSVMAGSRYKSNGTRDVAPDVPDEVRAFAQQVATAIKAPAPAYMLDVAREETGRMSIVEINSFSCSDLYECDPTPVVKAVEDWIA